MEHIKYKKWQLVCISKCAACVCATALKRAVWSLGGLFYSGPVHLKLTWLIVGGRAPNWMTRPHCCIVKFLFALCGIHLWLGVSSIGLRKMLTISFRAFTSPSASASTLALESRFDPCRAFCFNCLGCLTFGCLLKKKQNMLLQKPWFICQTCFKKKLRHAERSASALLLSI